MTEAFVTIDGLGECKFIPYQLTIYGKPGEKADPSLMFKDGILPKVGDQIALEVYETYNDGNKIELNCHFVVVKRA